MANEKRLIDANALAEQVDNLCADWNENWIGNDNQSFILHSDVSDLISDAPTVDAVPVEQLNTLKSLVNGEWVDCKLVQDALGIGFADGLKMFDFSRTAEWNPAPLNGQKITTKFRLKNSVDAVEVSRLGKLGQLMMPYTGCPRGMIGERGEDGTDSCHLTELEAITDIDGNRWVPVFENDLSRLKAKVDAVEVVYGQWELHGNDDDCGCSYFCSNCHKSYEEEWFYVHGQYRHWNHCPNCGADMRGEGNG